MKQYTLLFISAVIFLSGAIGVTYMVYDIRVNTAQISETRGLLEAVSERDLRARELAEFLEKVRPLKSSLDAYVIGDDDVVYAIELIEGTAQREGVRVSLSSVTIVTEDEWEHHEGIEVSLTALGAFANVAGFMSALESLPVASRVVEVEVEASTEGNWFGRATLFFVKEVYE